MIDPSCEEKIQQHRHEIRQLLHDTLAQTLFSASTISGILTEKLRDEQHSDSQIMLELNHLLLDAVAELKSIQMVLNDEH